MHSVSAYRFLGIGDYVVNVGSERETKGGDCGE